MDTKALSELLEFEAKHRVVIGIVILRGFKATSTTVFSFFVNTVKKLNPLNLVKTLLPINAQRHLSSPTILIGRSILIIYEKTSGLKCSVQPFRLCSKNTQ